MKLLTTPIIAAMLLIAARPAWLPLLQSGGDIFGISRTIDHAVYTLLNSGAIILWRLNAALISMSLFSYNTQDWLMRQNNGGVWQVQEIISGPSGFLGVRVWMALFALALVLFGFSRLLRPFTPRFNPVDPGQMLIYGVFSYVVIQQGATMMVGVEQWRANVGDWMYEGMAAHGSVDIDLPGVTSSAEPLYPPGDLDGRAPIRGWEAVATSYFLVTDETELNNNIPPEDFRVAYCLYDPDQPINEQTTENSQGCSPRIAWDEWDYMGSTGVITSVWGIELPISLGYELPILADHPENRELAIRQTQGGVARLALGPIVALYPMLEANISLMLALSAAILYLTIPIILLFGFFLYTQPLVNRLLLRFLTILINTIILHGLIGLLLLLLINVSVNGSLSAYLGLVGVAVLGGFILGHVALGTLKETLSTALSAVGGVWMGTATTAMGREAAPAARGMLGTAKLLGTGAALGAAGLGMVDLAVAGRQMARSGLRDLDAAGLAASGTLRKQAGQLPAPLARLAREELDTRSAAASDPAGLTRPGGKPAAAASNGRRAAAVAGQDPPTGAAALTTVLTGGAVIGAVGSVLAGRHQNGRNPDTSPSAITYSQAERRAVWQTVQETRQQPQYTDPAGRLTTTGLEVVADRLNVQGYRAFQGEVGRRDLTTLIAAQERSPQARGWGTPEVRHGQAEKWFATAYQAQETGRGQSQVQSQGESLFGEQLAPTVARVVTRRGQAETEEVLAAARRAALHLPPDEVARNGQLTVAGRAALQAELPPAVAAAFRGTTGQQDLETLSAAVLQPEVTPAPASFRQALAAASTANDQRPADSVALQLGLDRVATGPHYSGINRFARLSDEAGLTADQRERLVTELQTQGQVSPELQTEIEAALARQAARGRATGLQPDDIVRSVQALPETLTGPALPGATIVGWPQPAVVAGQGDSVTVPLSPTPAQRWPASRKFPRTGKTQAGSLPTGTVSGDVRIRLAVQQASPEVERSAIAAALHRPDGDARSGKPNGSMTPKPAQTAPASGKFPQIDKESSRPLTSGAVTDGVRVQLAAQQTETELGRSETAPVLRRSTSGAGKMADLTLASVQRTPASGEIPQMDTETTRPLPPGTVVGGVRTQLAAQQTEPEMERNSIANALRQSIGLANTTPAVVPPAQIGPASGEFRRMAEGVSHPLPPGTVSSDASAQLTAQHVEPEATRSETAAALRQPAAAGTAVQSPDTLGRAAANADQPDAAPDDLRAAAETETRAGVSLRPPLAPLAGPAGETTAGPATPPGREPLLPANPQNQASSATANLQQLYHDPAAPAPQQVAAALRDQAKAEVLSRTEAANVPAATANEGAASLPSKSAPADTQAATGSELKAAALAAAAGSGTATVAQAGLAGNDVAPGGGSSGVAAALRRGRVADDGDQVTDRQAKGRLGRKGAPQAGGKAATNTAARTTGDEASAFERTSGAEQTGGQVISLLPHHQRQPVRPAAKTGPESARMAVEPDRSEIEADAAVARAKQQTPKAAESRKRPSKSQKGNDNPKRTPVSKPAAGSEGTPPSEDAPQDSSDFPVRPSRSAHERPTTQPRRPSQRKQERTD